MRRIFLFFVLLVAESAESYLCGVGFLSGMRGNHEGLFVDIFNRLYWRHLAGIPNLGIFCVTEFMQNIYFNQKLYLIFFLNPKNSILM